MPLLSNLSEEVQVIDGLQTAYDLFKYVRVITQRCGFEKFSVLRSSHDNYEIGQISLVNNWNPELIHIYDDNKLATKSPILSHIKGSNRPLEVSITEMPQDRCEVERRLTVELFNDFNMQHGVCLPVAANDGSRGGLCLSGESLDIDPNTVFHLQIVATYVFDRLVSTKSVTHEKQVGLSGREIDCLSWTSVGKTTSEIATILDLSDHTVNHYLTTAGRKLGTTNRVHAVAKALRMGLLTQL